MITFSLKQPRGLARAATAVAIAGLLPTALYALYLGAIGNLALLVLLTLQGLVFAVFLTPVLGVLYALNRRSLWDVLIAASIAVGLIFFINTMDLCPANVTANIDGIQICVAGVITSAGWWSIALTTFEGLVLGLMGGVVFWLLAPKINMTLPERNV